MADTTTIGGGSWYFDTPENVMQANESQTQEFLGSMMGDAPVCGTCGHITIRSGSCYKCLNCGASMGCS